MLRALRRRGRDHADRGRARLAGVVLLGLVAARRGDPRRLQARPVLEHGEPGGALPDDRARRSGSRPAARSTRSSSPSARAARSAASAATSRSTRRDVLIVGADPEGSVYTATDDERPAPVLRRGDRQGHVARDDGSGRSSTSGCASPTATRSSTARRLAREEGLLVGGSSGTTVCGALAGRAPARARTRRCSTMLPDSGRSYLSKFLDDNWMLEHGFLERSAPAPTVRGAAAREERRGDDAGARHDLGAPEGRRGDRRDAALLDLAAPGRARRRGRRRSPT